MASLMSTNVYAPKGRVLIYGTCLESMEPEAFREICARADCAYSLCLEETHLNMAVTKLSAMLGTGRITGVMFASVDRSPHCVQLHYIAHEIERTLPEHVPMESFVASGGRLYPISPDVIELSKSLIRLSAMS